jgi:thioredoxin reductase
METTRYDVVVVGGSFAGMQAALTLGRACRSVLVVDSGTPRNAPAAHVHNFFGQAAPAPKDLHAAAQAALREYAITWKQDTVVAAGPSAEGTGWLVSGGLGDRWEGRAVVLATGLCDELPKAPGVAELWGRDVVSCPHCHGWEVRGQPLAQLSMRGMPAKGVERASLLSRWSDDVILFTDGDELTSEQSARMDAAGVTVVSTPVRKLVHQDGRLEGLELEDGSKHARRAVFVVTRQHPQTDVADLFGCKPAADGIAIATDPSGRTSAPGVWAAGTAAVPSLLAVGAAGHAATVALMLHNDLIEQDLAEASGKAGLRGPA